MTIENLHRVMWRLRKRNPGCFTIGNKELRRAIMYECGTDPRTYKINREALKILGWIKASGTQNIYLTDEDLTN